MSEHSSHVKMLLFGDAARQLEQPILERHPDISTVLLSPRDLQKKSLDDVNCLVGWRFPPDIFRLLPGLEWIQCISVGVDEWLPVSSIRPDVVITNTKGLYAGEIAEFIIWALLTLSRKLNLAATNQHERRWHQVAGTSLAGKTIGIAGMGNVGQATARLARSFGMRIVGIPRVVNDPEVGALVDEEVGIFDLDTILGQLDAVAICLPLTDQTRGLFGEDVIARLKPGAIIVNVAREGITDYKSLARAISSGRLGGAALDVFDKEPLSRRSPLWKTRNILVTPHVSGLTKDYKAKVANLISDNLDRFRSGRPLIRVVDRSKGY